VFWRTALKVKSTQTEVCATEGDRINITAVPGRVRASLISFRHVIALCEKYRVRDWRCVFRSVPLVLTQEGPVDFPSGHRVQNRRRDAGATKAGAVHIGRIVFAAVALLAVAGDSLASPRRAIVSVRPLPARLAVSLGARVADRAVFLPVAALPPQGQFSTGQLADPCKGQTKLYVSINQTANTQLVAGTASKKIYICSIHVVVAVATSVALVEGTGSVCATGTAGVSGFGGATAATGWNFAVNGGIVVGNGDAAVGAEGTSADNLCLFNSGSGQVSGGISYVVQ
jgi:hypothetical protein